MTSVRHQHGYGHVLQEVCGDTAEHKFAPARVAVGAQHNHVGVGKPILGVIRYVSERGDYGAGEPAAVSQSRLEALRRPAVDTANLSVKNGERYLELRKAPIARGGGIVIVTDVTERRKARAEIDLKETQLSMTLESMSAGIMLFDKYFRLALFNDAASELFRFPKDLLKPGMPVHALVRVRAERGDFGDGDPQELIFERLQAYRSGQDGHFVERVLGNRFLDVSAALHRTATPLWCSTTSPNG